MSYSKSDFTPFSNDSQRVSANLEQIYTAWLDTRRQLDALPVSMYWATKDNTDYLHIKNTSSENGTSIGPRSPETEARLAEFTKSKGELKARVVSFDAVILERAGLYRRLRLPSLPDRQAEILRKLDIEELLGNDLLVVGTNAFVAYELFVGAKLPTGNEETEDFDLAWCRGSKVSLAAQLGRKPAKTKTLFGVLKSIDSSYRISPRKPYQAVSSDGYEVELLAAPSTHPLPKNEAFNPMASRIEQEWLLKGTAISVVVATVRGRAAPLVVPDPRWMALHKLWLADKPERRADKRDKDRRQGTVLLDAARYFLQASHPLNIDFVLELPQELRHHFDQWCREAGFVPEP
ncbi:MAG: hypothetical protein A3F78_16345 [Burkholderiales bacterium RIFCSPLOWO2_12_FULL_61_40]|nr:MAG: hypothetical protein A3F78_16345 [Burkholderiales bacterium RIFCSPLOWO2_12_FULL_61_40]